MLLQAVRIRCTLSKILTMRNIPLTLAPLLLSATLTAQGVFSNKTQTILEKVIQDYPNHFYNIKGELIQQTPQTAEYSSTLQLPGSSSTIIILSTDRSEGSWTCTLLDKEGFGQAREDFRQIYEQIRNSIITASGQKTFILSGQYEAPVEDKKCTQVVFSLLPGIGEMKKLKVDLSLREEGEDWKISLSVRDSSGEEASSVVTTNR